MSSSITLQSPIYSRIDHSSILYVNIAAEMVCLQKIKNGRCYLKYGLWKLIFQIITTFNQLSSWSVRNDNHLGTNIYIYNHTLLTLQSDIYFIKKFEACTLCGSIIKCEILIIYTTWTSFQKLFITHQRFKLLLKK